MRAHLIRGAAWAVLLIGAHAGAWAADDWPQYRHDTARTGEQEEPSVLSRKFVIAAIRKSRTW
jgi:hypothetical protein